MIINKFRAYNNTKTQKTCVYIDIELLKFCLKFSRDNGFSLSKTINILLAVAKEEVKRAITQQ